MIQGRNQERVQARQRRDRAAEVLAEVRAYLTDATPDRLGFNASEERSPQTLVALRERRDRFRVPLLTLAGSHPSAAVRSLARQLEVAVANTQVADEWFIGDLLGRTSDARPAREEAIRQHEKAGRLCDQLLNAIHEPETRRPVGSGLFWRRRQLPGRQQGGP